jgi:hypothetical protein
VLEEFDGEPDKTGKSDDGWTVVRGRKCGARNKSGDDSFASRAH